MTPRPNFRPFAPVVLLIIVGVGYLATNCRHLYWGDAAEFVLVARYLGIAHPTGYPLFSLLGRLFTLMPIGEVPFRVNLVSALAALASVYVLYRIVRRLTGDEMAAVLSGLVWGFSFELWDQATRAEIYTLHVLLVGLVIWAVLEAVEKQSLHALVLGAFLTGLAFANHMTTILLLPPLVYYLYVHRQRIPWRRALPLIALFFTLPLLLYLYLPLRSAANPPFDYDNPESFGALYNVISGHEFRYRLYLPNLSWLVIQIGAFVVLLVRQYYHFLLVGGLGLVMAAKDRRVFWFLLGVMLLNVLYALMYNIPDKEGYYLPAYLLVAVFVGYGLKYLRERARGLAHALMLLIIPVCFISVRSVDKRTNRSLEDFASAILKETAPGSVLFTDDLEVYFGLSYVQLARGGGPHAVLVCDYWLKLRWYLDQLRTSYPALKVDKALTVFVIESERKMARLDPVGYGEASKELVRAVKRRIIKDNIDRGQMPGMPPVCLFFYDDREWRQNYEGWPLKTRGLVYEITSAEGTLLPGDLPYPSSLTYNVPKLRDKNAKYVALRFAGALNRSGITNMIANKPEPAVHDFTRALEYDPAYNQVYKNLGFAYLDSGDTLNGRRAWQRFLELEPRDEAAGYITEWLRAH